MIIRVKPKTFDPDWKSSFEELGLFLPKDIPELIKLSNPEINHHIYVKQCDEFHEGISYMQYTAHIYRILTESTWHYHPDQALDLINERQLGIREDFYNKIPPADCALDVGYCCG